MINIHNFLDAYIECALWSTTDSRDEEVNDTYSLDEEFSDVSEACRAAMLSDCVDFLQANNNDLELFKEQCHCDDWRLGFLFWLNRSGHGSGFWDESNSGELGGKLSDACKPCGDFDIYGDFDKGVVRSHHHG